MDRDDELIRLTAMRGLLETRLLVIVRVIEDERKHGAGGVPDLVERMESLLARLRLVNGKLAELRGAGAAT